MAYPKWKYRNHAEHGFQSTLVGTDAADAELSADGWTDDPTEHGVEVVPYPVVIIGSDLMHDAHEKHQDANGNFAHGPAPTVEGIVGAQISGPTLRKIGSV